MRKAVSAVIALLLAFCISFSASAASGINSAEQQIINAIATGADNYTALSKFQNVAKNYFNKDSVDVSQGQADEICKYLQDIFLIAAKNTQNNKILYFHEIQGSDKKKLLSDFVNACAEIDLTISYDQPRDRIIITDASGEIIFESLALVDAFSGKKTNGSQIKKTGTDYLPFYITMALGAVSLVAVAVVLHKRKEKNV